MKTTKPTTPAQPFIHLFTLLSLLLFTTCQKEPLKPNQPSHTPQNQLSVQQAKAWYDQQLDTIQHPVNQPIDWNQAIRYSTSNTSTITIPLKGSPTFQHVKQGFRQLQFRLDSTQTISARILEIIPDAIQYQQQQTIHSSNFSGRLFAYNLNYQLQSGILFSQGKAIGSARPANPQERKAIQNQSLNISIPGDQSIPTNPSRQLERMMVSTTCYWTSYSYIDAEGTLTVYAESHCSFYIDNYNYDMLPSIDHSGNTGGGGGGGAPITQPEPAQPSNLPMEEQASKDPKKLMDCFGTSLNPNAAYQVKILVQQPQPGTSFNIGQNAFGHVAIQLTKTEGNSTITQTLGFYPTGTGLDKLNSNSRIVDNGGLEYNTSATYYTNAQNFQNLINYIKNPPQNYHYTDFNCTSFVYQAALKAGLPIPNPSTQIGLGGPGGVATAMTPAGMASALNNYKAQKPSADISNATMRATASKGECN